MLSPAPFREAQPLGYFIEHLAELPPWVWLYIAADESSISLATVCHATATDSRNMSEEEIQELELSAESDGLLLFLSRGQLQDIVENLSQQRRGFTSQQLTAAIDFYWKHDAFIDLSTHAG
jgi:hypothetical protein